MRRFVIFVLAPALVVPALGEKAAGTQFVTVAQLQEALASASGTSDGALAKRLSGMHLTERLSDIRFEQMEAHLAGNRSREQLLVLSDESSFFALPEEDKLSDPAPDRAVQVAILARVADYIRSNVAEWPSFSALRATTRFEGTATVISSRLQDDLGTPLGSRMLRAPGAQNWECPGQARFPTRRLDVIERATLPMLYRRGHVIRAFSPAGEFACMQSGVNTADPIGEVTVLSKLIAAEGKASWSHWEQGRWGKLAVFRFAASINYAASVAKEEGKLVELEGELAVDPADGSIRRLTEIRRWRSDETPREYDTTVEFGPIAMNQVRLLLPIRRVAMFLTPILKPRSWGKEMEATYRKYHLEESPLQEYLNDASYSEYRPYSFPSDRSTVDSSASAREP